MYNNQDSYDLHLQIAVNQMLSDIYTQAALVLVDVKNGKQIGWETVCFDETIIKNVVFTPFGFRVFLFLPTRKHASEIDIEVRYQEIEHIVCYYEDLEYQRTLFSKQY